MASGPAKPRLAVEIAPDRVIAARASEDGSVVESYATRALSPKALSPGLSTTNVLRGDELRNAISGAMANVGGRSRDAIVVIPDAAARVMLLDFDSLPDDRDEAASVVRFRLRKSLPFDVEHAALSYDVHRANGALRVVAAVAPRPVIEEYESAVGDSGYFPGVVLPSMVATLGIIGAERPTMVVKLDGNTVTLAIVDRDELRLVRTLENPAGATITGAHIASEIYPSVVFFEDTFGSRVEEILIGGVAAADLAPALHDQTNARVQEISSSRYIGGVSTDAPSWALAGVAGALVS